MNLCFINKDLQLSSNKFFKQAFKDQSDRFTHIKNEWSIDEITSLNPDHIHFNSAAQPVGKFMDIDKIKQLRSELPNTVFTWFYADALKSEDYRKKLIKLMDKSFYTYKYPGTEWMPVQTNIDFWNKNKKGYKHNIIFIGNVYAIHLQKYGIPFDRQKVLKEVVKVHKVTIVGNKWNKYYGIEHFNKTSTYEQTREYYLNSLVGLNIMVDGLRNLNSVWSARLTHMMLCGLPCFTPKVPGLDKIFEDGKELLIYNDTDDLMMKLDYYMKRINLLKAIGIKGKIKMNVLSDIDMGVMRILETKRLNK